MSVSIVSSVIHKTYRAINIASWHEILWPTNQHLLQIQNEYKIMWGLPSIMVGAIDGTHIYVSKLRVEPEDFFLF